MITMVTWRRLAVLTAVLLAVGIGGEVHRRQLPAMPPGLSGDAQFFAVSARASAYAFLSSMDRSMLVGLYVTSVKSLDQNSGCDLCGDCRGSYEAIVTLYTWGGVPFSRLHVTCSRTVRL